MAEIIGKAIPPQRQRVLDAMNLREPDRVPIGLWGTVEGYQNLRKGLGMQYNPDPQNYRTGSTTWTTDVAFELDIAEKLDLDFVRISIGTPGGSPGFDLNPENWTTPRGSLQRRLDRQPDPACRPAPIGS